MLRDTLANPLPLVAFGDTVPNPPPPESVTYYLNGPYNLEKACNLKNVPSGGRGRGSVPGSPNNTLMS